MNKTFKTLALGALLALASTQVTVAEEEKVITIAEMEINMAMLAKEIAEEKVKLYQKEALLQDMQLDLLKQKQAQK